MAKADPELRGGKASDDKFDAASSFEKPASGNDNPYENIVMML